MRVGEIIDDSAPPEGQVVREQRLDETEIADAKYATLTEIVPEPAATFAAQTDLIGAHLGLEAGAPGVVAHEVFESIYNPGSWRC